MISVPPGYMSVGMVASAVDVSETIIRKLASRGIIRSKKENGRYILKEDEWKEDLLNAGKLDENGKYLSEERKREMAKEKLESQKKKENILSFDGYVDAGLDAEKVKKIAENQKKEQYPKNPKINDNKNAKTEDVTEDSVNDYLSHTDIPDDLRLLLDGAVSTKDMAQIINYYWTGKRNRQNFEKERGELISVQSAKAAIEMLLIPIDKKLNDLHIDLKNRFPNIHQDAIDWINHQVNDIKTSIQEFKWDS